MTCCKRKRARNLPLASRISLQTSRHMEPPSNPRERDDDGDESEMLGLSKGCSNASNMKRGRRHGRGRGRGILSSHVYSIIVIYSLSLSTPLLRARAINNVSVWIFLDKVVISFHPISAHHDDVDPWRRELERGGGKVMDMND